jgi:hypothetical protein
MSFRQYRRTSSGIDAGVHALLYRLTIVTAPVWVPVLLVVAVYNQCTSNRTRRLASDTVAASVAYSPGTCGQSNPLAVTVRNAGTETLNAVDLHLQAYRPGRSTDLLESSYSENTIKWDKILPPGQADTLCFSVPPSIARAQEATPDSLQWRFSYKYARFH